MESHSKITGRYYCYKLTRSTYDNYVDSGFSEDVFKTTPVQAELTDPITGIFTPEKPFDPNSINNVDYLNGFLPGKASLVLTALI